MGIPADAIGRENLAAYAVSVAYRINERTVNRNATNCKVCNTRLERGQGVELNIFSLGMNFSPRYCCSECVQFIRGLSKQAPP